MKIVLEVSNKLKNGDLLYYENDTLKTINKVALFKSIEDEISELTKKNYELQVQLDNLKNDVSNIATILKENI